MDDLWTNRLFGLGFRSSSLFLFSTFGQIRVHPCSPPTTYVISFVYIESLCFFKEFLFVAKVTIIHRKMQKKWQSSLENLAKSGYQPEMKYKTLIGLLHFCLHTEKPNIKIWQFVLIFPWILAIENLKNHFNFEFLSFNFAFWRYFTNKNADIDAYVIIKITTSRPRRFLGCHIVAALL